MSYSKFKNEFTYKKFMESNNEVEFDRLFDDAILRLKKNIGSTYPMYISGKAINSDSLLTEYSPIDKNIMIGRFQCGKREHAKMAIDAAKKAFDEWHLVDYKKRVEIFKNFAVLLSTNKFDLAALLSLENGKSRYESIGEVDEAIDFANYYANDMETNKGYIRKNISDNSNIKINAGFQGAPGASEIVNIKLLPVGVFGVIAPFNFPISISSGMSIGAMITGNTVVFKPSSTDNMTMLTGLRIYQLLKESGLPDGVFNFITGPGSEVGDELVVNKDVSGIAFTGSYDTGINMIKKSLNLGLQKNFVVEMGGKNPAIVSKHADIEKAVDGISSAAFGYTGQKCSALSRVYVHSSIKEIFISKLIDKVRTFHIGDPLKKTNYIGPLISENAYIRYVESINKIKRSGSLLYGGNRISTQLNGYYVEPVVAELKNDDELVHNELFLPILAIIEFDDFNKAIEMANNVKYGLTAGLYTKNKNEIKEFSNKIAAGVVYINRATSATTGAVVGLHTFVGWKASGFTGKGSGSKYYLQQFMREQSLSLTK